MFNINREMIRPQQFYYIFTTLLTCYCQVMKHNLNNLTRKRKEKRKKEENSRQNKKIKKKKNKQSDEIQNTFR